MWVSGLHARWASSSVLLLIGCTGGCGREIRNVRIFADKCDGIDGFASQALECALRWFWNNGHVCNWVFRKPGAH